MDVDRKTVKRNLMNLLDLDCGIEYTEISKKDKKKVKTRAYRISAFRQKK